MKEIIPSKDNNHILSVMLADEIQKTRYKKSNQKVCDDLGIDFFEVNNGFL